MARFNQRIRDRLNSFQNIGYETDEEENNSNEDLMSNDSESNLDGEVSSDNEIVDSNNNESSNEEDEDDNEYKSKDSTNWFIYPTLSRNRESRYLTNQYNFSRRLIGPTAQASSRVTKSAWSVANLFLTDDIIKKNCKYTNICSEEDGDTFKLDVNLFKKFIGLVLARSIYLRKGVSITEL